MSHLTINHLQEMDWKRFEELCHQYFLHKGYDSQLTASGADGGVDVVLKRTSPEGKLVKVYVQCKAWSNQKVGVKVVRELYGVMAGDQVPIGIFITASDFTDDAMAFAKGKKLQLISGERLLSLISQLPEDQHKELADQALAGDYTTPSCPKCEVKMVLRTVSKGKNSGEQFWGCRNFPSCRQRLHVKGGQSKASDSDDFYDRIFNTSRNRSRQYTGSSNNNWSSGGNDQTKSSYRYSGASASAEAWAAESSGGRNSRQSSKSRSNGKVLLVSIVLSIGLVAGAIKAIGSVFDWFGASMVENAQNVQQGVQQSHKQSESGQQRTQTASSVQPVTDSYDEQVFALERKAALAYELELAQEMQRKSEAWEKWYELPWRCDDWRSEDHMVECVNHKRKAKEAFDILWAEGKLK
ncbi:restriction endonuclease [Endozoicomonas elysicola]|uniref:restriction endonuclease n=1 Tax=Endozoicomonas elysicola TaxID=305900 RepID=UPI001268B18C|nr:restriction endonuclease [Endozoicomonas elysicola]